jgi:glycogen debranching enzyme
MPDPWTTGASAPLAQGETVTLVEGSAFCISGHSGDLRPEHPEGLFFRDTRFLSELRVRVNGQLPEPLGADCPDPFSATFVLRDHPRAGRADSHVMLFRRRYVGRGMREDLTLQNYGEEPAYCSLELAIGCDFADLFEVKEGRVEKVGEVTMTAEDAGLTFNYRRGAFRRATQIGFTESPRLSGPFATYEVIVPPRGEWQTCMQVTPVLDKIAVVPRYLCGEPEPQRLDAA